MSLIMPPSTRFAHVLRIEAKAFLQRQDAFVASVIAAIGSTPVNLLPAGHLLLEDYRADDNSDGYLRFLGGADGRTTVLVEVASLRRSGWFRGHRYEVKANVGLPKESLNEAWRLLQTGVGLEQYQKPSEHEMLCDQLTKVFGREVYGNIPGGRICLQ
jgi:hypothetical protein